MKEERSKRNNIFGIMLISGGIEVKDELEYYQNENNLKKMRDRCRYGDMKNRKKKKERGIEAEWKSYIESYKHDGVLTDRLTAEGKKKAKQMFPKSYEKIEKEGLNNRSRKDAKNRQRMIGNAKTLMNMLLAGIPYMPEDKEEIKESREKAAYYTSYECKEHFQKESWASRANGVLVLNWEECRYDVVTGGKKEKEEKKEIIVVYNLIDRDMRIMKGYEDKFKKEALRLQMEKNEKGTCGTEKIICEILYGNEYEMVNSILKNNVWEPEKEKGKTCVPKTKEYSVKDMINIKSTPGTYFVPNGRKGSVCTKLLAYPGTAKMLYEIILQGDKIEKASKGMLEDGWLYSKDGREEFIGRAYILFPLRVNKLTQIANNREKAKVYILESQEEYVREFLRKEDLNEKVEMIVYKDKEIEEKIEELLQRYEGNYCTWE